MNDEHGREKVNPETPTRHFNPEAPSDKGKPMGDSMGFPTPNPWPAAPNNPNTNQTPNNGGGKEPKK